MPGVAVCDVVIRSSAVTAKPGILFLSQCLPYPPHSGVTNRTFNILKQLQPGFDVTLLAYARRNHQANAEARHTAQAALASFVKRVGNPVPIQAEHAVTRRLWDHVRSVATQRPYTYYEYGSRAYGEQLRRALAEAPPALIHLDSLDMHRWLPWLPAVPHICTHHNIESDLLRLRANRTTRMLRRYILHQAALVERVDRQLVPRFRLNIMMSELDAQRLRRLAPGARTLVVPNGVDTTFFVPDASRPQVRGRVVFVGPTYLFANRDGVDHLLERIWPLVRSAHPSATLHLIGKSSLADRMRYERVPGVACLGFVPDIRPHLAEACCSVVPLRVGGGTRLKILDSWAMGKAIVSTSLGCEGLDGVDGKHLLIRDDPSAFAKGVSEVLSNATLRRDLERNARQIAEQQYSWDRIGEGLRTAYREIIESGVCHAV